jgi:pyridoxamine 5'-phosphate oxidase
VTADDIRTRREEHEGAGLDVGDLAAEPSDQWQHWYEQAVGAGSAEPNAFVLATVGLDGAPDARHVLARGVGPRGIVFHTDYRSAKSRQLDADPRATAVFAWLDLHRQVRVRGTVERLPDDESDAYFATRPRPSQISAWASPQSSPLPDRAALERRVADVEAMFAAVASVPRPVFWGGWLLRAARWEFWQGRRDRLHDRLVYQRADDGWSIERLAP